MRAGRNCPTLLLTLTWSVTGTARGVAQQRAPALGAIPARRRALKGLSIWSKHRRVTHPPAAIRVGIGRHTTHHSFQELCASRSAYVGTRTSGAWEWTTI